MPPQTVTNPTRRFVLTQTVASVEANVAVGALLPAGYTTDAPARSVALSNAAALRLANPTVLYKLYSPSNGGAHVDGDLVWRSDIEYG